MDPIAFTVRHGDVLDRLITPCGICPAFDPTCGLPHPEIVKFNALWDTGATNSAISPKVVAALGIRPYTMTKVFHAQGESMTGVYLVNIFLPNNVAFQSLRVSEGILNGCDVLIGMDIISHGDFSITHKNKGTVFSFQIPSTHEYDFVKQIGHTRPAIKRKH